jgi:hypothetical protein
MAYERKRFKEKTTAVCEKMPKARWTRLDRAVHKDAVFFEWSGILVRRPGKLLGNISWASRFRRGASVAVQASEHRPALVEAMCSRVVARHPPAGERD